MGEMLILEMMKMIRIFIVNMVIKYYVASITKI